MSTLASVYFLNCCRPYYGLSFCYYVDFPKFVNSGSYVKGSDERDECQIHGKLCDHRLYNNNNCTDHRAWSADGKLQRDHFLDVSSGRKRLCDVEGDFEEVPKIKEKPKEKEVPVKKEPKETPPKPVPPKSPAVAKVAPSVKKEVKSEPEDDILEKSGVVIHKQEEDPQGADCYDDSDLDNDILRKLDCNLAVLEDTFDKFVCKNRCFIQNLVQCLNFEKQKQKELEADYCKLKHDNGYLEMLNKKQLHSFRNELDKGLNENKCLQAKIQKLECQLKHTQEELQYQKQNQIKYLDAFEHEKQEKTKLKCDIRSLKGKEVKIFRNYVKLLNVLVEVKKTLNNCNGNNKDLSSQRSSNSIGDCDDLCAVIRKAGNCGDFQALNVRDLSIIHDAVQERYERLCHENEFCGKNPLTSMSISQLSMIYTRAEVDDQSSREQCQEYDSSSQLSMYPSKQEPDEGFYSFC